MISANGCMYVCVYRELHLSDITENSITLWRQREAYIFKRNGESYYTFDNDKLTIANNSMKRQVFLINFFCKNIDDYSDGKN